MENEAIIALYGPGTGAILWYDGETITRCSSSKLPDGRTLPKAFVVSGK